MYIAYINIQSLMDVRGSKQLIKQLYTYYCITLLTFYKWVFK